MVINLIGFSEVKPSYIKRRDKILLTFIILENKRKK
jgi:hypothetical protein